MVCHDPESLCVYAISGSLFFTIEGDGQYGSLLGNARMRRRNAVALSA